MAATRFARGAAAEVYIYKVEMDGQIEAIKTTKLP